MVGNSYCGWLATDVLDGWQQLLWMVGNSCCRWMATVVVDGWQQLFTEKKIPKKSRDTANLT